MVHPDPAPTTSASMKSSVFEPLPNRKIVFPRGILVGPKSKRNN